MKIHFEGVLQIGLHGHIKASGFDIEFEAGETIEAFKAEVDRRVLLAASRINEQREKQLAEMATSNTLMN